MSLGGELIFAYRAGIFGFIAGGLMRLTDRVPLALLPGPLTDRALWARPLAPMKGVDIRDGWYHTA